MDERTLSTNPQPDLMDFDDKLALFLDKDTLQMTVDHCVQKGIFFIFSLIREDTLQKTFRSSSDIPSKICRLISSLLLAISSAISRAESSSS